MVCLILNCSPVVVFLLRVCRSEDTADERAWKQQNQQQHSPQLPFGPAKPARRGSFGKSSMGSASSNVAYSSRGGGVEQETSVGGAEHSTSQVRKQPLNR